MFGKFSRSVVVMNYEKQSVMWILHFTRTSHPLVNCCAFSALPVGWLGCLDHDHPVSA